MAGSKLAIGEIAHLLGYSDPGAAFHPCVRALGGDDATGLSGEPQCFLTEPQLLAELRAGGFAPDRDVPLRELNRPRAGSLATAGTPVIYEAVFRRLE